MASYNSGVRYNTGADRDGFNYNGKDYVHENKLHETITLDDNVKVYAICLVREKAFTEEAITVSALQSGDDSLAVSDGTSVSVLNRSTDIIDFSELIHNLIATVKSDDIIDLDDILTQKVTVKPTEKISLDDIAKLSALISAKDGIHLYDNEKDKLFASGTVYGTANIVDGEPRTSESDIYVAKDPDGLYDILLPFGLIIDWSETDIPFVPEATDDSVKLSGIDGEIVQTTVYEPRVFNISAVTFTGLTIAEKEEIKAHIARVLHSIKHKTARLTMGERETTFDVKYTGQASAKDYAGWVRFDLPLKAPSPLGKKEFARKLRGSGLLINEGDDPCGFVITLVGPWSSPSFTVGDVKFAFGLSLGDGEQLIVDTEKQLCKKISGSSSTNAVPDMTSGDLALKIPVGSLVLSVDDSKKGQIVTDYQELVVY